MPLRDGSFERSTAIHSSWRLDDAVVLGSASPVSEVAIDNQVAVDGSSSVRFYADVRTRRFQDLVQDVQVSPGTEIRARAFHQAKNLRVEFQQNETDVHLSLTFLNEYGEPITETIVQPGRLSSHPWEVIEITAMVPEGATHAQVRLRSAVSGRSWFDAVTVVRIY